MAGGGGCIGWAAVGVRELGAVRLGGAAVLSSVLVEVHVWTNPN